MGTYMGYDGAGNRYYENRVDYPFGQHRWVEPGDIHNFDSSSIAPEWHGWMTSMNDQTPSVEEEFLAERTSHVPQGCRSDAGIMTNVGHQEPYFNFHAMHNQSQIRSRGYGIGNQVVGLPPNAPDAYYTQPGSPYNPASLKEFKAIGEHSGGRVYKSQKWAERLLTADEKASLEAKRLQVAQDTLNKAKTGGARRLAALRARGAGTIVE
jgi:hypothetical protein